MANWTLEVEDFGKIKKASIEVAPFTLFVGDNNSGKSYIMSLLYGLLNSRYFFSQDFKTDKNSASYRTCIEWSENLFAQKESDTTYFSKEIFITFNTLLNELLELNKNDFVKFIFNREIAIGKLKVNMPYHEDIKITFHQFSDLMKTDDISSMRNVLFNIGKENIGSYGYLRSKDNNWEIIITIINNLMKLTCFNRIYNQISFLPASRTGLVLTYKTLTQTSLQDKFNTGESKKNLLTRPYSDFLVNLSALSTEEPCEDYSELVEFAQSFLIDGTVDLLDLPSPDIRYQPNGTDTSLPMFVTSGVVTELTPLLLFLKYEPMFDFYMMEEPEMCLHPQLQWRMARLLIKLVNTNTPLFVTTHSDTMLQHINNMIKLNANPNKKDLMNQYGYQEDDLISPDQVTVYQFDADPKTHQTNVKPLKCGTYGFEVPTFNDMLGKLLNQSRAFETEE